MWPLIGVIIVSGLIFNSCGAKTGLKVDSREEADECSLGDTQETYSGPPGTANVGLCQPQIEECQLRADGWLRYQIIQDEVVPSEEVCDGLDNDCNGEIDDFGNRIIITGPQQGLRHPTLAWSGPSYEVCWEQMHDILCTSLDQNGENTGTAINLTFDGENCHLTPNIVWNGNEFGITWLHRCSPYDDSTIEMIFLNGDGEVAIESILLPFTFDSISLSSLGGNDQGFIACANGLLARTECAVINLNEGETLVHDVSNYGTDPWTHNINVFGHSQPVWHGEGWSLCLERDNNDPDPSTISCLNMNQNGQRSGEEILASNYYFDHSSFGSPAQLVRAGSSYGLFWHGSINDTSYHHLFYQRLNNSLQPEGEPTLVAEAFVREGRVYFGAPPNAVVWTEQTFGALSVDYEGQLHLTRIDINGDIISNDEIATSACSAPGFSMVWDSTRRVHAVTWLSSTIEDCHQSNHLSPTLFFQRFCYPE